MGKANETLGTGEDSSPLGKYNRIERVPNAGWTAYESVFQDPKIWMQQGKQDMIVPMMYYLHKNFFPFVDNWVDNCNGRLVVPGLGAYRMDKSEADWAVNDITDRSIIAVITEEPAVRSFVVEMSCIMIRDSIKVERQLL